MPQLTQLGILSAERQGLAPRAKSAGKIFTDENLNLVAHVLDDWFRVPGTKIRFGFDGVIGLVPGLGDIVTGLASCIILVAAWVRGVPYVTLMRMVVNLGVGVVIGTVPFLGDAFDIGWKANRRNYALLVERLERPRRQTWKDWFFLGFIAIGLLAIFLVPMLMLVWLVEWLRLHV
jgi:Domain of unknown function (DUF4112)